MKFLLLSVCSAQYLSPVEIRQEDALDVVSLQLDRGTVTGLRFQDFDLYRGIPYAEIPERFEIAKPVEKLENFNGTWWGPICYQDEFFITDPDVMKSHPILKDYIGKNYKELVDAGVVSENCLSFDLYVPRNATNVGVLFWIHGGGFSVGDRYGFLTE